VIVVGGGVSGLVAAWRLAAGGDLDVTVLEQSGACGGKLRSGELGGLAVDLGAESVLARRPEALDLFGELGLGGDVVHPVTSTASVFSRAGLHPLPAGTVMGVPRDPAALRGLLTDGEVARVAAEAELPATPVEDDVDVGPWVAARFGRPLVDRLVEPLLGGVYAGRADRLSLAATVPPLWEAARGGGSVLRALAQQGEWETQGGRPVFAGLRGGLGRLPVRLAERLAAAGVEVRTGTTVRGLDRTATGWLVRTGPMTGGTTLAGDAVLLAVPPAPAARLLASACPPAAAELAAIETASVALVTVLLRRTELAGSPVLRGSGLLVPPVEGHPVKAATFSASKWAWVDALHPDLVPLRMSLGRAGEAEVLQRGDPELVRLATGDLSALLDLPLRPVASTVTRWGGGLPQYAVGHLDRVRRLRAAVDAVPGLAVCGAALDGVGVPACIAAAGLAAARIRAGLRTREPVQARDGAQ
jgi:oxygen-dependent protoporphyrinogen oxidase